MKIEDIYKKIHKAISTIPLVWCGIAIIFGLYFVRPVEAVVVPLMGLFMFFMSEWSVRFLFAMQSANSFNSNEHILKNMNVFFWSCGIFGAAYFLVGGVYFCVTQPEYGIYYLMVWPFPLGISVGAFKSLTKNA